MKYSTINYHRAASVLAMGMLLLGGTLRGQAPNSQAAHAGMQTSDTQSMSDQIQQLREQVANLQATIQRQNPQRRPTAAKPKTGMSMGAGSKSMGMMGDMGEMGGMSSGKQGSMPMGDMGEMGGMSGMGNMGGGMPMGDKSEMGGMSMGGGMGNMGMMGDMGEMGGMKGSGSSSMSGMGAMGGAGSTGSMAMQSALPGSPGASHLYHVGSTGFFLDHPRHITLSADQRTRLNQIKERAMLDKATAQRKIDEAEQQLFSLTGADQPDRAKIEAQIKAIENLRTQQRLAFIQAVGEASQVLTEPQRQALLGKAATK